VRARLRGFALAAVLLAALLGTAAAGTPGPQSQKTPVAAVQAAPQPARAAEVRPAPLSPREQVGFPVFLACLWLAIAFLLYFLRLRIREADRVFRTGFYGKPEGHERPPEL
jgi:hypothetical protein